MKNSDDFLTSFMAIIGIIVLVIIFILIAPFLSFWLHYFGGWLTKIIIGNKLAAALNVLFNTTYFTADMIPIIAGALGWIGSFFKGTTTIKNKNKNKEEKSWF